MTDKSPQFNACADIASDDILKGYAKRMYDIIDAGDCPLQTMLDMQESLQVKLARDLPLVNKDPKNLDTCGEILQWMKNQDDYLQDETRELYTALGGMSNPKPNAIWKPWRKEHLEYQNRLFTDLSPADQMEVKYELIDQFHFFMNKFIALGMDSNEIFAMYCAKNHENFERQKRGY